MYKIGNNHNNLVISGTTKRHQKENSKAHTYTVGGNSPMYTTVVVNMAELLRVLNERQSGLGPIVLEELGISVYTR